MIVLELLARRWPTAFGAIVRKRLVVLAVIVYVAVMAIVTGQALVGQSVVSPSGPILVGGIVVTIGGLVAAAIILLVRPSGPAPLPSHPRG